MKTCENFILNIDININNHKIIIYSNTILSVFHLDTLL
jgi:hypothetical protein